MTKNKPDIHFDCQIEQAALVKGEVVLLCNARLTGDKPLRVLPWNTPLESRLMGAFLEVTNSDDEPLSYQGMMVKRAAPQAHDYLEIKPGKTQSSRIDLTRAYAFCAASQYTISYHARHMIDKNNFFTLEMEPIRFATSKQFPDCSK